MLKLIDHFLISEYKYLNNVEFESDYEALSVMRAHKINDIIIKFYVFGVTLIANLHDIIIGDPFRSWMMLELIIITFIIRRYDYVTSNFN